MTKPMIEEMKKMNKDVVSGRSFARQWLAMWRGTRVSEQLTLYFNILGYGIGGDTSLVKTKFKTTNKPSWFPTSVNFDSYTHPSHAKIQDNEDMRGESYKAGPEVKKRQSPSLVTQILLLEGKKRIYWPWQCWLWNICLEYPKQVRIWRGRTLTEENWRKRRFWKSQMMNLWSEWVRENPRPECEKGGGSKAGTVIYFELFKITIIWRTNNNIYPWRYTYDLLVLTDWQTDVW